MNSSSLQRWSSLWRPWAGLAAGLIGWGLQHQLGTYVSTGRCVLAPHAVMSIGIGCALFAAAGGALSLYQLVRGPVAVHQVSATTYRFIAALSAGAAALFLATIALQTTAALVIPPCAT